MAQYRDIVASDGSTLRVYQPPTRRIMATIERLYPEPKPPIVTEKTGPGKELHMEIVDDPAYLQALEDWKALTDEKIDEMGSLFMFKDLKVPDDWDVAEAVGAEVSFFDPDWKPREGAVGRKLDYLQWVILDLATSQKVNEALADMTGIDLKEVNANEASFRGEVEGQAD